jgi:hypothetical protein
VASHSPDRAPRRLGTIQAGCRLGMQVTCLGGSRAL